MNVVYLILIIVAVLIVFLLFLALITKAEYHIERDIVVNRPISEVFDYIKHLKNQEQYSIWVMQDPTNQLTYRGVDGTVGCICAWEGKKQAGKGEQEIVSITEGQSTEIEVRFEKPFKNVAQTQMDTTVIHADQTNVKWQMRGRNKFPMTLFNLVIDQLLGKDMQKSLVNLKVILEEKGH